MKGKKKIKVNRTFNCDKSIVKGIKWLNRNGFYTIDCCSGMKQDHINYERDKFYIEFAISKFQKILQIKNIAGKCGFGVKHNRKGIEGLRFIRVESEENDEIKLGRFNAFIEELKKFKPLNLRAMGISNRTYDKIEKKYYSVQFYDYDLDQEKKISPEVIKKIMGIFPYDCIMYESKHGVHFISFSLLHGLNITKARAIELSKRLGNQDYWTTARDLTLRISPKWKIKTFSKQYKIISDRPKFKGLLKEPNKYRISKKHLEFFFKYMNLPKWVYDKYNDCDKKDLEIKIYHYKTRD